MTHNIIVICRNRRQAMDLFERYRDIAGSFKYIAARHYKDKRMIVVMFGKSSTVIRFVTAYDIVHREVLAGFHGSIWYANDADKDADIIEQQIRDAKGNMRPEPELETMNIFTEE